MIWLAGIILLVVALILGAKGIKSIGHSIDARQHLDFITRVNPARGKPLNYSTFNPAIRPDARESARNRIIGEWASLTKYTGRKVRKAENAALRAQLKGKENPLHQRRLDEAKRKSRAVEISQNRELSFVDRMLGTHRMSSGGNVSSGFQRKAHKPGTQPPLIRNKNRKTVAARKSLKDIVVGEISPRRNSGRKK